MFDYTSAAKAADSYQRNGGPDYGAHMNRRLSDPRFDHACHEAMASQQEPVTALPTVDEPPMATAAEKAAERAQRAEQARSDTIEGRVRVNAWAGRNPHD